MSTTKESSHKRQLFTDLTNEGTKSTALDNGQFNVELLRSLNANQVGGGNGLRFYQGEGSSWDWGTAKSKADMDADSRMISYSDSTTYHDAITQFPDANVWGEKPGYEEEFFKQYGYYPKDMPKDDEGYDIGHEEYMQMLQESQGQPEKKGKINLFDLLKRRK